MFEMKSSGIRKTGWIFKLGAALLFESALLFASAFIPAMTEAAFATALNMDMYYIDHNTEGTKEIQGPFAEGATGYTKLDTNTSLQQTLRDKGTYVVTEKPVIITQLTISGNVNLVLMDDTMLVVQNGIHVEKDATLNIYAGGRSKTIRGNGKLYAGYTVPRNNTGSYPVPTHTVSTNVAAGIGGYSIDISGNHLDDHLDCGKVVIHGGIIKAAGMRGGAGIGGSDGGKGGEVVIYDGTVTATGDVSQNNITANEYGLITDGTVIGGGAGIGGGSNGDRDISSEVSGGYLTVYGGIINATGSGDGYFGGAGIGGGGGNRGHGGKGASVTIKGGFVTAAGAGGGAGIGGGNGAAGTSFEIHKGVVAATGAGGGAGIGGGSGNDSEKIAGGNGGNVRIYGGSVEAAGSELKNSSGEAIGGGAGIGGGSSSGSEDTHNGGAGASLTINGGIVKAVGTPLSKGIGGGSNPLSSASEVLSITGVEIRQSDEDVRPDSPSFEDLNKQYVWIEKLEDVYYTEYMKGPEDDPGATASGNLLENGKYTVVRYSPSDVAWDGNGDGGAAYVAYEDTAVQGKIRVSGKVNLILCDEKTMYARSGIQLEDGAELNIYAGSTVNTIKGTGILKAAGGIIDNSGEGAFPVKADSGIGGNGTVTINGGCVTTLGGGFTSPAAEPGGAGAGIGANAGNGIGGDGCRVIINGGVVEARGGDGNDSADSAPVPIGGGAGLGGNGSSIIINGGIINAYGTDGGAGIGGDGGTDDPRASVTINGGCVTAMGGSGVNSRTPYMSMGCGAGIGSGSAGGREADGRYSYVNLNNITVSLNGGCVTAMGGGDQSLGSGAGIGGGGRKAGGNVYINGGKILATGGGNSGDGSVSGIGSGKSGDVEGGEGVTSLRLGIGVKLYGKNREYGGETVTLTAEDGAIADRDKLCHFMWTDPAGKPSLWFKDPEAPKEDGGINSCSEYNVIKDCDSVALSSGWCNDWKTKFYAVEGDVTVPKRIEVTGNLKLILCDGATLTAPEGIHVPKGSGLTIYAGSMRTSENIEGTGVLTADASSLDNAAGIGGNGESGGSVNINDVNVTAIGGSSAAGIGTDDAEVTISGNSVKAVGSSDCVGIKGSLTVCDKCVYTTSEDGNSWTKQDIPSSLQPDGRYRYMAFCTHVLSYSADGATVTAACKNKACFFKDGKATLTIARPLHTHYSDGKSPEAVITDDHAIRGGAEILYYAVDESGNKTGSALTGAPTDIGKYMAEITVGEGEDAVTAFTVYSIKPDCSHSHTELRDVRPGTCSANGYSGDIYCPDCDSIIEKGKETPKDPDNHHFDFNDEQHKKVTREPTLLQPGVTTYTCVWCGNATMERADIPCLPDEKGRDLEDLREDVADLSGNDVPRVEKKSLEDGSTEETVTIGGEEVSRIITDPESGKETVESKVWVAGLKDSYIYTGSAIRPAFHVYDGMRRLIEKTDYTVTYSNRKNVGISKIKLKFNGNYSDTKQEELSFEIKPAVLGVDIIAHETGAELKKGTQKPMPVLTRADTGKTVGIGSFNVSYDPSPVKEARTYTATITPKKEGGNFAGSTTATITVADKSKVLSNAKVIFDKKTYAYTGKAIVPGYTLKIGDVQLAEGTDYKRVSIMGNTDPGTAAVIFEAVSGNPAGYVGSKTSAFRITGKVALKDEAPFEYAYKESVPYAKGGAEPSVTVRYDGVTLKEGKDYTVSYKKNKAVTDGATAEIKIKGKGKYKDTVTKNFSVTKQTLKAQGMTATAADQFSVRSKLKKPTVTVTDVNGEKLKKGTDYTAGTDFEYTGDEDSGTVTVTLTGKGNYKDDASESIKVTCRYTKDAASDIDKTKAMKSLPGRDYTGNAVRLSNADLTDILYAGSKDSPDYLVPGKDFRITGYSNNIKTGTAKVTLQGLGYYAGTKTLTFKIVKRKIDYKGVVGGGNK
ncbi:MAG: hypothetical protein J5829_09120 [Lachnospiraceae bacterium]|nr:hypothetical protein [Lachnospiraceae bacterium]